MRSRESFNTAAELYNEVRPSYPNELIDWVIKKIHLQKEDDILEIAPGTGQATKKFAERGYTIHAVELGNNLARLLQENMSTYDVTVDVSPFEEWIPNKKKHKLIYCATAWHWIDPQVKYKKTYDLLEEDGRLALLWNNSLGTTDNTVMDTAFKLLFSYHNEPFHSTKHKTEKEIRDQITMSKESIEDSGHFVLDDYFQVKWILTQPKERVVKGFKSQSSYLSLSDEIKQELDPQLDIIFKDLEPEIDSHFRSTVYLCKKRK